jgi:hypothetical protein
MQAWATVPVGCTQSCACGLHSLVLLGRWRNQCSGLDLFIFPKFLNSFKSAASSKFCANLNASKKKLK